MASVNKAILVGRVGKDPEVRYLPDGGAVTSISVACSDSYKDKSGNKIDRTEWVRVVFFSKLAEIAGEYLKKGALVYIEGRLQTRKWQDKDGVEKYTTEIVADRMQMLGGKSDSSEPREEKKEETKSEAKPANKGSGRFDDFEDDIPF